MPQSLTIIPESLPIVNTDGDNAGTITEFFRLAWESLRTLVQVTPLATTPLLLTGQKASIPTTDVYAVIIDGLYELKYYIRKTAADGVSSSLTVTLGWIESGIPFTEVQPTITVDTTNAEQSGSKLIHADVNSALTIAVAYASNTPAAMVFRLDACAIKLQ